MGLPDINERIAGVQPMGASVENVFEADKVNANGDQFIGTAINNVNDGMVSISTTHTPNLASFTMPVIISSERQAFILMKVLYRHPLTDNEKAALPDVLTLVGRDIIGEGPAAVLLKHIQDGERLFKDEDLLEQCIRKLTHSIEQEPVMTIGSTWDDIPDDSPADGYIEIRGTNDAVIHS